MKTKNHSNTPAPRPVSPLLTAFLRNLTNARKSPSTVHHYREAVQMLLGHCDHKPAEALLPEDIDEFIEDLAKHRAAGTVNLYKSGIRAFYRFLLETEKITKDPSRLLRNAKIARKSPPVFSAEQRKTLLDTIDGAIGRPPSPVALRDFSLYTMLFNAGLRLSEVLQLDIKDVEGQSGVEVIGKGRKVRWLPLNSRTRRVLKRYLAWRHTQSPPAEKNALFINRFGKRLGPKTVQTDLKQWLKRAGIEDDFWPHLMRHTFGTELQSLTGDIRVTQAALGHESPVTTQIYARPNAKALAAAVESLG